MKPKIIYIIGDNRSGSTLLDYLLSCHPKATSVGELHNLYEFYRKTGDTSNFWQHKCSCGEFVENCIYWKNVLSVAALSDEFETRVHRLEPKWSFVNKSVHKRYVSKIVNDKRLSKKGEIAAKNCWRIYQSVFETSGKKIIIDSSKNGYQAYSLFENAKAEIYFLVIERDIMAVSYSKERRLKGRGKPRSIYTHLISSYKILWRNRFIAQLIRRKGGRVKTIEYCELTRHPQDELNKICKFVDIESFTIPSVTNATTSIQHVIGGSPSRYLKSTIKPDERWKSYYKGKPFAYFCGKILRTL